MSTLFSRFRREEFFPAAALSVAGCFMLFFYAPMEFYFSNIEEFWYDFYAAAPPLLLMLGLFLFLSLLAMALLLVFHPKLYRAAVGIYAVAFLATYAQGTFFSSWLPALNGGDGNWAAMRVQRYHSLALWGMGAAVVAAAWYFLKWAGFRQAVGWVANGFALMLAVSLVALCLRSDGLQSRPTYTLTGKNELVMSGQKNYVIFLLDAVGGRATTRLLREKPEYREVFRDFTYYDNITAGYPLTSRSIPFFLSGTWFENERSFSDYEAEAFRKSPLLARLEREGYSLGMYDSELPKDAEFLARLENAEPLQSHFVSIYRFCVNQLRLAALRYGPYDLKPIAFRNLAERMDSMRVVENAPEESRLLTFHDSNTKFESLLDTQPVTLTQRPAFRFIHLEGAHVGFNTHLENGRIATTGGSYAEEVEVSFYLAKRYMEALKKAGVYNNTCIVVMSDHGNAEMDESWELALERIDPMLFVKGFGEIHDAMRVSGAPICHGDLTQAFLRLADGAKSDEIFDWQEGDRRERRFLACLVAKENDMREYVQTERADDLDTLLCTGRVFAR